MLSERRGNFSQFSNDICLRFEQDSMKVDVDLTVTEMPQFITVMSGIIDSCLRSLDRAGIADTESVIDALNSFDQELDSALEDSPND